MTDTPPTRRRTLAASLAVTAALAAAPAFAQSGNGGHFTSDQAQAGKKIYGKECASCHGSDLGGDAGPALAGKAFADNLDYSGMSAKQLYDFISKHMPKNEPGSLSDEKYHQVFAYLLCANGFKPGDSKLEDGTPEKIDLLPLPSKSPQPCD